MLFFFDLKVLRESSLGGRICWTVSNRERRTSATCTSKLAAPRHPVWTLRGTSHLISTPLAHFCEAGASWLWWLTRYCVPYISERVCLEDLTGTALIGAGCWESLRKQRSLVDWTIKGLWLTNGKRFLVGGMNCFVFLHLCPDSFLADQDQTISHLKDSIMRQKDIAIAISNELDVHNGLCFVCVFFKHT